MPVRQWAVTITGWAVVLLVGLAACQSARQGDPGPGPADRPIPALSLEELIAETARLVPALVNDAAAARVLLDRLDEVKSRLAIGDRRGARPLLLGIIQTIEALVERGALSPTSANALLLYAGSALGVVGVQPLCEATPGPSGRVPYFIYFSEVCVARLAADPTDPDKPLAPNAREHCNPVSGTLQQDLVNQALATCQADAYTCAPATPASCPEGCCKDVRPGYSVPTVSFIPDARQCRAEPVKKHLCQAIGAYECSCSCPAREST